MAADIIIIVCIASALFFALRSIIKHKSVTHCGTCSGNCEKCTGCVKDNARSD